MAEIKWKTQEEIEQEKNAPRPPTELEVLQERVALQEMIIEELAFVIIPEIVGGIGGE